MSTCQNCGASSDGGPANPSHCESCPPWTCQDCGQECSATTLCSCWTSLDDMPLPDMKALFAVAEDGQEGSVLSLGPNLGPTDD